MSRSGLVPLAAIALIAAAIGWFAPFDVYYTALTGNSAPARTLVIAGVAILGGLAAQAAGLRLVGHGRLGGLGAPAGIGLAAAVTVAGWVLLLDCLLFRARLAEGVVAFLRAPLDVRLVYFMLRAFNENVIYRLFGFGGAVWLWTRWRGRPGMAMMLVLAVLVQAVNIGANVVWAGGGAVTLASLGYDGVRYIVPGVVWAWLFVRHGFATAEVASVGCHVFLQPGYSLWLDGA